MIHLSVDVPSAVNTSIPESCGYLFSFRTRNLVGAPLFNTDMNGELDRQQEPSLIQKVAEPA
ncbi:MAG TPA: hypothetical protein VKR52_06955 [Terracidiphilus sp.]|nr:hypothetical protein [Terracidiphilus sp.]